MIIQEWRCQSVAGGVAGQELGRGRLEEWKVEEWKVGDDS